MFKCSVLFVCLFVGSQAYEVTFIKPCGQKDSACMLESAKIAMPYLIAGIKELDIPPLDPLKANDVNIDSPELTLSFKDVVIHGLSKCDIQEISRDPEASKGTITLKCPIKCVGNYNVNGTLLVVSIAGEGPFEISGDEILLKIVFGLKKVKDHYKITGFDFTYEPLSEFKINLENLYNGDKAKAEPVQKVLAQSSKEVIKSPTIGQPVIKEFIVQVMKSIAKIFKSIPADKLEIVS